MSVRFDFEASVCQESSFRYTKMDAEDLRLLQRYNVKTWDHKAFAEESILKRGYWTINENRDRILMAIGGGAFEIPEMYTFIYDEALIQIECGGGGNPARTFKSYEDNRYDLQIHISSLTLPYELSSLTEDILTTIAEALAIEGYASAKLNKLSIVFPDRKS